MTVLHERPPLRDDLAHALTLSRQLRQLLLVPLHRGRDNRRPVSLRVQEIKGVPSIAEAAALVAAGSNARLLGARVAANKVTCAIAIGEGS